MKRPEVCGLRDAAGMLLVGLCCRWPALAADTPREVTVLEPPGVKLRPTPDGDPPVLISGRMLTPAGQHVKTHSYSWGMAISPDETHGRARTAEAIQFFSLNPLRAEERLEPFFNPINASRTTACTWGAAFRPTARSCTSAAPIAAQIVTYDVRTRQHAGHDSRSTATASRTASWAISRLAADGRRLYGGRSIQLPAGHGRSGSRQGDAVGARGPQSRSTCAFRPTSKYAWVSNVGMFEYPLLPGVNAANRATAGLAFPAYGVPSHEAEEGVTIGGVRIPGLGSPNHPDAMSVFKVNLANGQGRGAAQDRLSRRRRAQEHQHGRRRQPRHRGRGHAVGLRLERHERHDLGHRRRRTTRSSRQIELNVPGLEELRGVLPFGLDLSPDESRLYVACAGLNAVAVVDTDRAKARGLHPGRLVLRRSCAFARRPRAVHRQRQGHWARAQRRARLRSARARLASRRHHAGPVAARRRARRGSSWDVHAASRRQHVPRAKVVDDGTNPLPPAVGVAQQPDPARRVHRQGEPHVRPGVRPARGRPRRPDAGQPGRNVTVRNKKLETRCRA